MAWLACDKDGSEYIFAEEPTRYDDFWNYRNYDDLFIEYVKYIVLPKGSIKKLIGKELTWDDEPVELKE